MEVNIPDEIIQVNEYTIVFTILNIIFVNEILLLNTDNVKIKISFFNDDLHTQ